MKKQSIIIVISSFFYIGYLPLIPGTFGSIAGLFLYFLVKNSVVDYVLLTTVLIISGFFASGKTENILKKKDASCIVIDEVSGMLLCFVFLPYDIKLAFIGFFLFRILDTLKPFPAGRLQNLKGSLGVMSDDIIAAVYTNIILQIVLRVASFKIS